MRRSIGAVFCLILYFTTAAAQTKGPVVDPPKKPAKSASRPIPAIKCTDPDTATACKSLKELLDARDERLVSEILGQSSHSGTHFSYVCLRPKTDAFSVIEFDAPGREEYHAFPVEEIARFADDSVPLNREMRKEIESTKELLEETEFSEISSRYDKPAVSSFTKEQWYQDHSKDFVYRSGFVIDEVYQDGLSMRLVSDSGEWTKQAGNKEGMQGDSAAWFLGGFAWIERYNLQHGNVAASDDDPEQGHIRVDPRTVYVHYKFKNTSNAMVDYKLQIHRGTGRFVEAAESQGTTSEITGTCLVFK